MSFRTEIFTRFSISVCYARGCLKKSAKRIAQICRNALEPSAVSRASFIRDRPGPQARKDQFFCCWSAATFSSARLTSDFLPLPTARSFFCRRRFKSAASSSAFSRRAVAAADSFVAATNAALAISSSLCGISAASNRTCCDATFCVATSSRAFARSASSRTTFRARFSASTFAITPLR